MVIVSSVIGLYHSLQSSMILFLFQEKVNCEFQFQFFHWWSYPRLASTPVLRTCPV